MSEGISAELPRYKCHKEVWALKIQAIAYHTKTLGARITPEDAGYAPFEVSESYVKKHWPQAGGYWVRYDDGYESYSPAKPFEDGYTRI